MNWTVFCIPIIKDKHYRVAVFLPQSATIKVIDSMSSDGDDDKATVTSALLK